jgi:tRNA dimethylallyltransferase
MIDIVDPEIDYSVAEFQARARGLIEQEKSVLVVGGSGLHFRSIVDPLEFPPTDPDLRAELERIEDPAAALLSLDDGAGAVVDLLNSRRVVRALEIHQLTGMTPTERSRNENRRLFDAYHPLFEFTAVGIDPGDELATRIHKRVLAMKEAGWWEEAGTIGSRLGRTAQGAVGYRELLEAQAGERDPRRVWDDIAGATRGLARRQRTYFRRDPRIKWVPWETDRATRMASVANALGLS